MKEFKNIPVSRSGDAGTDQNTSVWPYFQMMQFIKDDITPELNEGKMKLLMETVVIIMSGPQLPSQ